MYHSVLRMLRYHMVVVSHPLCLFCLWHSPNSRANAMVCFSCCPKKTLPGRDQPLERHVKGVVLDSTLRFRMLDFSHFQKPINNTVGFCSEGRLCTNMVTQCYTYANWALTAELLPPRNGSPQVTTDPPARIAANAKRVA